MTVTGASPPPAAIERSWPALMSGPELHLHQLDRIRQAALFVHLPAGAYRAASFLDGRSFTPDTAGGWVDFRTVRQSVLGTAPPATPLHFIFHMGHTGSTLLSRLLDESGHVQPLREPLVLREFADIHDRRSAPESLLSPQAIDEWGEMLLRLWSRCGPGQQCAILKATSSAGRVAPFLMAARPASRALYLSMAPEPYLAVILGGPSSILDIRGHAEERARRLARMLGPLPWPVHTLGAGQLTALSWVAEALTRQRLGAAADERLLQFDFDSFLHEPAAHLEKAMAHFGLPGGAELAEKIARSPAMGRYAKAPEHAYSSQLRDDVMRQSRTLHGGEISAGMRLLEDLAKGFAEVVELLP